MRKKIPLYAVIRVDGLAKSLEDAHYYFHVLKAFDHLEDAKSEVERLNRLNGPKGARYFWQYTRYYPDLHE